MLSPYRHGKLGYVSFHNVHLQVIMQISILHTFKSQNLLSLAD